MTRYLLFAVLGTALFWIAYRLLLRKEHSLRLNRFFLLSTLVLSLLLPLVHPRVAVDSPKAIGGGGYLLDLSGLGDTPEASINNQSLISAEVSAPHGVDVWQVLGIIYGVGVALGVLLLGVRYVVLWRKLRKYEFVPHGCFREAVTDRDEPSFSFFRYIVAGRGGMSDTELQLHRGTVGTSCWCSWCAACCGSTRLCGCTRGICAKCMNTWPTRRYCNRAARANTRATSVCFIVK